MKFDKTRVYTALNADELKVGSKCIFADTIQGLKKHIETKQILTLVGIYEEHKRDRFIGSDGAIEASYSLAYLIEPSGEPPAKFKYKPFSNMENLKKASVKYKGFIKTKQGVQEGIIIGISFDNRVIIKKRYGLEYLTTEQLFESYTFDDGSPCGELVEG